MTSFHGLPAASLDNGLLRLDYLTQAGLRLVRLQLAGQAENLLAETPDISWPTPYGPDYHLIGGHRLWLAPETEYSSYPEPADLQIEAGKLQVHLTQAPEPLHALEKTITVKLHPQIAHLTLDHQITNHGRAPLELACWAITQLPLGGQAILPQPDGPLDQHGWQPNRTLVLWPYASWQDPRLELQDHEIRIAAQAQSRAFKLGYFNRHGWIEYQRAGVRLRKRFTPQPQAPHPDFGCNVEVYVHDRFIELETLGPLHTLQPGESSQLQETWEIEFAGQ
ncbi:MAG: hypothetical protein JW862_17090 [Anaerolineales bacterium]|nr:hypothetical protein [Anaerolineales bacterium]